MAKVTRNMNVNRNKLSVNVGTIGHIDEWHVVFDDRYQEVT